METFRRSMALALAAMMALPVLSITPVGASSHMDAPAITLDDSANTTDVYAFVTERDGIKYLTTAVAVYPFEEPGIGPNIYRFDDNVLYALHVATGDDLGDGRATFSYEFLFDTRFKNRSTIRQAYLGPINDVDDANQNLTQTYRVTRIDNRKAKDRDGAPKELDLGGGVVPPNNQGLLTFKYNQNNDGEMPAKEGVSSEADLDDYTKQAITDLANGHRAFAGQRDDGFYADIQSIFDLDLTFGGTNKPFDSQGGFNLHTIVLEIPVSEIGGDQQVVGVYATTSRQSKTILSKKPEREPRTKGRFVQVARQGNPLFNEALVALEDKDLYNRTSPTSDRTLFEKYALEPELAAFLAPLLGLPADRLTNRTDIAGIFIPDVIKVDLSTGPARLAGNPDDEGFHRLGIFGGDFLVSSVQVGFGDGVVPGGFPNGRRFGDDVLDAAVIAIASDLRVSPPVLFRTPDTDTPDLNIDRVPANDITHNKVMPYAATPLNGRNHQHHH